MIARIRDWCRTESLGIVLPVVFVVLFAAWSVLQSLANSFVYPFAVALLEDTGDPFDRLEFTVSDTTFDWSFFFTEAVALLLLLVVVYYVFIRRLSEEEVDEYDDRGVRECPECFSEIFVEARRCAFCTSPVTPIVIDTGGDK